MTSRAAQSGQDRVASLYQRRGDMTFEALLRECPCKDDEALADLIDADGRSRLRAKYEITLVRYMAVVTDLVNRPVPLDAAIDFSLRSLMAKGLSDTDASAQLRELHPSLAAQIDSARELAHALSATRGVVSIRTDLAPLKLPCDVGPLSIMGKARYLLTRQLGVGSQGTTYLADDRQLSTPGQPPAQVAVKMLAMDHAAQGRALAEAAKARRINHASVVRVLDRGVYQGREYIVYELIEGKSLDAFLAKRVRPIRPQEAAKLLVQIARGVQAAHSAGLVHRDLKPDNILITEAGEPKITDFGAAAIVELDGRSTDNLTAHGPVGNLAFMAPEQFWMNRSAIAPSADLYALGGLLFYLITGTLPNGTTAEEVRLKHTGMNNAPKPARTREGRPVDPDLLAICNRAMATAPHARHTSADALAADLEDWLAFRPIPWTKPTLMRQLYLALRRQPLLAALLVALLVIVLLSIRLASITPAP